MTSRRASLYVIARPRPVRRLVGYALGLLALAFPGIAFPLLGWLLSVAAAVLGWGWGHPVLACTLTALALLGSALWQRLWLGPGAAGGSP